MNARWLLLFVLAAPVFAREPFLIAGRSVAAGQRLDFDLPVPAGDADPATHIPVTVVHGAGDGPVLTLTAGIHGYEYVPILAMQRLLPKLDAAKFNGTLLAVRVAHVPAYEHRTPIRNPYDRKNLNRSFPGRADGTQTERIAHVLSTVVIPRGDFHVDLHGGDGGESLEAFAGIYGGQLCEAQYARSREIGLAFGFRNIVKYSMNTQRQVDEGRSCNRQAVALGKPTVLVEIGENGRADEAWVAQLTRGLENLLRVLKLTSGPVLAPRQDLRWFDDTTSVSTPSTGIYQPTGPIGRFVKKGDLIGTVKGFDGRELHRLVSPVDGFLLYGSAGPAVRAGDSIITIALPVAGLL